ncbi:MAG: hypothetical protein OEZ43_09905 [Gammaproteobacteria bacterium]|nr:hypothetical protein [Gammaproteobacteria bacterium]
MNLIQIAMIRFSQALVGLFFILVVSSFFGILLLLPLAVLYHSTSIISTTGINGIVALLMALPICGGLFYYGYKIEGLYSTILETGLKLIKLSKTQINAFEKLLPHGQDKSPDNDTGVATPP